MSKKSVLLTGASRGIGKAIALNLLEDGFFVFGTTRKSAFAEELLQNNNFRGVKADLSLKDDIEKNLIPIIQDGIDIIINNAGICVPLPSDADAIAFQQNWDKTMMVNLSAPVVLMREALATWKVTGRKGIIINITSRAAYRGDTYDFAAYAASKAALGAYSKSLLRDCGRLGISVFTIAPGFTDTDMATPAKELYGEDFVSKDIPLGEITPPEQIAELVNLLAHGKVSHLSGSALHINGGSYML